MTIKVTQSTSSYSVKIQEPIKFKIGVSAEAGSVAGSLTDLDDFDPSGVQNNYIVMYNAATQKYITVDPDVVLEAAAADNVLPEPLIDALIPEIIPEIVPQLQLDAGIF